MEHTSTNELPNGLAYAEETITPKLELNTGTEARDQLAKENDKELSTPESASIAEPYRDTHIILRGNDREGYIALLGLYKVAAAPTFQELINILEKPTAATVIHIMNIMIESYDNYKQIQTKTDNANKVEEKTIG